MEIQFDAKQVHQLEAIFAVDSVLDGQSAASTYIGDVEEAEIDSGVIAVANSLALNDSELLANLTLVQEIFDLAPSESLGERLDLTIEMETGTGKTYTYLRTIQEMRKNRGFKKFIIVGPTIAIREGIAKSEALTRVHFAGIYGPNLGNFRIYDSSKLSLVRDFSISNQLEVLLIGLDSFNKESNLIYTESEELDYNKAIDLISACRPVVILDEPQNMEGPSAQKAISRLAPIMVLRYSATHRNIVNLVYRLDPVEAYELGLVKKIDVLSVTETSSLDARFEIVAVTAGRSTKNLGRAKIRVDTASGSGDKTVRFGLNDDFVKLSGGRSEYSGFTVVRIDIPTSTVHFANGVSLRVGEQQGTDLSTLQRRQIRATIREHLEREVLHREAELSLKVLSLFFIDSVKRYAEDDGEIREWFVEEYTKIASEERFACLNLPTAEDVHLGYFAKRSGNAVDTRGNSKADRETYELIMRDKERLLDVNQRVRFIFSHSALREGWDNPNVFQICTLNLTRSEIKKRQEIGRGLRLPVQTDGTRCTDPDIARLTVIANESYEDFARDLQREFEEDCGVSFKGTTNRRDLAFVDLVEGWDKHPLLLAIWALVARETSYRINLDTDTLVQAAAEALGGLTTKSSNTALVWKAALDVGVEGVIPTVTSISSETLGVPANQTDIRSVLSFLHLKTGLTRATLLRILLGSNRTEEFLSEWTSLNDLIAGEIKHVIAEVAVDSISYNDIGRLRSLEILKRPFRVDLKKSLPVSKSIYDRVPWQSDVERDFALGLEARTDVLFFLKFPNVFTIETLIGSHTPDWVIALKGDAGEPNIVVVETKGDTDEMQLRESEKIKTRCAKAHFDTLGVHYSILSDISKL